ATFPVKAGPDLTLNGDLYGDAFVAKVNAAGTGLVYAGYIGGNNSDYGFGIAVDIAGNAYVTGDTFSTEATFPVKAGPDLTYNGDFEPLWPKSMRRARAWFTPATSVETTRTLVLALPWTVRGTRM
ncbi:MAG: SBBP repeat-containing protein, partial [Methylococcales bacterium]